MPARILVVDDENTTTSALDLLLRDHGYDVNTASTAAEAETLLARRWFEFDQVLVLTDRAVQFKTENRLQMNTRAEEREDFGLIGNNPGLRQLRDIIRTAAPSDASVLIEGESGTGKEMIATALHVQSGRAGRPFIRINCAAIPSSLIESELFGYRKGAFTGADHDRRGLIEATAGGTLLLDEIAEMPVYLQTKLLRVLQERKVRRLGDEREIPVDFRLISSTNRETSQMIADGTLRQDLYFRLSTVKIKVPSLRERPDDIALLSDVFLLRLARKYKKPMRGISPASLSILMHYNWPGNVRELEGVIEHAVLFSQTDYLQPEDLPDHLRTSHKRNFLCVIPPYLTKDDIEREAIAQTLERTGGNIKKTAQILNYNRPTLYRKLRRFGLRKSLVSAQ